MTYAEFVTRLQTMAVDTSAQLSTTMMPAVIESAELRIYRDLDLLNTVARDSDKTLTAGNRSLALTPGQYVTVQQVNIITPVTAASADAGTRNSCTPVSKDWLDMVWPSNTGQTLPQYFAMLDASTILLGPWPDAAYRVEIVGTARPTPLSAANPTTFLSLYLPDLFLAAAMIFVSGYQKNFGAQADDPKMAMSWQQQYDTLKSSAFVEEARKKFQAAGWTSMSPTPVATPGR